MTYYYDTPEPITDMKLNSMVPVNGSTGYFWYRVAADEPYSKVAVPGIIKHPENIKIITPLPGDRLLLSADKYLGYSIYNTQTQALDKYMTVDGRVSNYATCQRGDNVYMTGYFGAPLLRYKSLNHWNNTISEYYDPNINEPTYDNPQNLGFIGNNNNVGKAFSCAIADNGKMFLGGERVRSGIGGAVISYDPNTDITTGILAGFEEANVRNVVKAGRYIVSSSYSEYLDKDIRLSVIDPDSHQVLRFIHPIKNLKKNAGRLLGTEYFDAPYVYMLTSSDDNNTLKLLKINVETGITRARSL